MESTILVQAAPRCGKLRKRDLYLTKKKKKEDQPTSRLISRDI